MNRLPSQVFHATAAELSSGLPLVMPPRGDGVDRDHDLANRK